MKILITLLLLLAMPAVATPLTHGIMFSWTNPTGTFSANTLYCGTTTGTYTMNWVLPVSSSYDWTTTDTQHTGVAGTKYYCAVTVTSTAGIESGYSSEVSATFPQVPAAPLMSAPTVH